MFTDYGLFLERQRMEMHKQTIAELIRWRDELGPQDELKPLLDELYQNLVQLHGSSERCQAK